MSKFIISTVTTWDDENQLWETKVGSDDKDMPLLYSVWHKEESRSRLRAMELVECLQIGNAQPVRVTVGRNINAYLNDADIRMKLEVEHQLKDGWRPGYNDTRQNLITSPLDTPEQEVESAGGCHE